jgi:hypothetical protein
VTPQIDDDGAVLVAFLAGRINQEMARVALGLPDGAAVMAIVAEVANRGWRAARSALESAADPAPPADPKQ